MPFCLEGLFGIRPPATYDRKECFCCQNQLFSFVQNSEVTIKLNCKIVIAIILWQFADTGSYQLLYKSSCWSPRRMASQFPNLWAVWYVTLMAVDIHVSKLLMFITRYIVHVMVELNVISIQKVLSSYTFNPCLEQDFDGALDCVSIAVTCAFNKRGSLLAVGCNDGRIVIWDFLTRGIAKWISAHVHPVCSLR